MKEELYLWMKNLAVFYILFTAVLHLIPEKGYERYVRLFMGLLLILMMCMPVLSLLGKGEALADSFQKFYEGEEQKRQQQEFENLQALYLKKGYEQELGLSLLGKGEALADSFQKFYEGEEQKRQQQEFENLQALYLKKGYEQELGREILAALKNKGIEVQDAAVHIEGEQLFVTLYVTEEWSGEQEGRMADELRDVWGIQEGAYQIKNCPDDGKTMADVVASGAASRSDGPSGFP